jgi:hypothetical protein
VLDPLMAETSAEVRDRFVRSLPAHVGRARPSMSDENKDAPGDTADERTTS